jgi:23S rRNA (cytidine1920-2'-O)/16S rRNA (cytidine1409-2'-O)-methyltransferase
MSKLEKAVKEFNLDLNGCVCMDIGASTGGFTDCMLINGAVKVYSIDVGYGQLAWKLRSDSRVVNMERTNFRYVTHEEIPEEIDFASVDVSFISLKHIIPPMRNLLRNGGRAVCLIKPQFEAGKEHIGKGGIVRDRKIHRAVIERLFEAAEHAGLYPEALTVSPIEGGDGNREYLALFRIGEKPTNTVIDIQKTVFSE